MTNREGTGRVTLVTGASGGIGLCLASRFAEQGFAIAVHYHSNSDSAESLCHQIAREGGAAKSFGADLSQSAKVEKMFDDIVAQFGRLDVVVANAGQTVPRAPVAEITDDNFEALLNANVRASFYVLRAAARRMADGGRIIAIGSSTTVFPGAGQGAYAATKTPVATLVRVLSIELAKRGITANTLVSGPVDAGFLERYGPEIKGPLALASPIGRLGLPDDIADAAVLLASHGARWITGQSILVNGGAYI